MTIPTISFEDFLIPKQNSTHICNHSALPLNPSFPPPQTPANLLCVSKDLSTLDIPYKHNHTYSKQPVVIILFSKITHVDVRVSCHPIDGQG